ncbi:hypothetical protein [Sphaerisporangium sp. TRM90804]|uniref:hypothetical protein n=1 Tax=Sphaerisporangium sp. TRM90804 TaxID=3031113 RepID=UPI00244D48D9|nr:hypothetical protein [Sphaerisporangium sp. TRM90804]MDH2430200.1 hypothetical protein [Sphaerisporangium sp. TRM90804]
MTTRGLLTPSAVAMAALTVLAETSLSPVAHAGDDARSARAAVPGPRVPGTAHTPPAPGATGSGPSFAALVAGPREPEPPAIRSVRVRPRAPVAGARQTVRLVVDVVARGAAGRDGVTLKVEHGGAPRRAEAVTPEGDAGGGWELWRFTPPIRLNRWYPSGRWRAVATARNAEGATARASSSFLFRKATRVTGLRAARTGGRSGAVRITGTLMRVDPRGRSGYWPYRGQAVTLQFRRHGTSTWRDAARVVSDRNGYFAGRGKAARGAWRAVYRGTPHYAATVSPIGHVATKRIKATK